MKKRVVITGLGAVSPLGIGHQNFWENICAGKNGITDIDYFDVSNFSVKRTYKQYWCKNRGLYGNNYGESIYNWRWSNK